MAISPAGVEIDGSEVRRIRKLLGDNLVTFAPKCGITFQYLSQIETGVRMHVSPEVFARICDALGLGPDPRSREALVKKAAA